MGVSVRLSKLFGQNVRAQRRCLGLTQESLSEAAGIHYTFVGHIERGTKLPSIRVLDRLASALDLAPCQLLRSVEGDGLPPCLRNSSGRTRRSLP